MQTHWSTVNVDTGEIRKFDSKSAAVGYARAGGYTGPEQTKTLPEAFENAFRK